MDLSTIEEIGVVVGTELTPEQWEMLNGVIRPPVAEVLRQAMQPLVDAAGRMRNVLNQPIATGEDLEVVPDGIEMPLVKTPPTVILCTPVQHGGAQMETAIEAWIDEGYCLIGSVQVADFSVDDSLDEYGYPNGNISYHQGPHFYATMTRKKDKHPNVTIYGGPMDGLIVQWGVALRLWGKKMINKPTLDGVVNVASKGDKCDHAQWDAAVKHAIASEEMAGDALADIE